MRQSGWNPGWGAINVVMEQIKVFLQCGSMQMPGSLGFPWCSHSQVCLRAKVI